MDDFFSDINRRFMILPLVTIQMLFQSSPCIYVFGFVTDLNKRYINFRPASQHILRFPFLSRNRWLNYRRKLVNVRIVWAETGHLKCLENSFIIKFNDTYNRRISSLWQVLLPWESGHLACKLFYVFQAFFIYCLCIFR